MGVPGVFGGFVGGMPVARMSSFYDHRSAAAGVVGMGVAMRTCLAVGVFVRVAVHILLCRRLWLRVCNRAGAGSR